jgi:hypothetical protein
MKTATELPFDCDDIEFRKLADDYLSLVYRLPKIEQDIFLNGYNGLMLTGIAMALHFLNLN